MEETEVLKESSENVFSYLQLFAVNKEIKYCKKQRGNDGNLKKNLFIFDLKAS